MRAGELGQLSRCSTVYEQEAQIEVMSVSIPSNVVSWLIENDALHRLYAMSKEIEKSRLTTQSLSSCYLT